MLVCVLTKFHGVSFKARNSQVCSEVLVDAFHHALHSKMKSARVNQRYARAWPPSSALSQWRHRSLSHRNFRVTTSSYAKARLLAIRCIPMSAQMVACMILKSSLANIIAVNLGWQSRQLRDYIVQVLLARLGVTA